MNVTELAHWKYRVEALTVRVTELGMARDRWLMLSGCDPEIVVAEASALADELYLNQYLLEEAKYKSILGALGGRPVVTVGNRAVPS